MASSTMVAQILARYDIHLAAQGVEPWGGAGGFSGASLWRIPCEVPTGTYCLRRWPPEHPSRQQLEWIHARLHQAHRAGCDFLPVPVSTRDGATFVETKEGRWELAPWLPGQADFRDHPTNARLQAAMNGVARLHRAWRTTEGERPSPGVELRWHELQPSQISPREWTQWLKVLGSYPHRPLAELCQKFVTHALDAIEPCRAQLAIVRHLSVPQQPIVRDLWHDHLLYRDDQLTGIVDFGAMRIDTVASDLARLLGSLVTYDPQAWTDGLAAYETWCPLSPHERTLIGAFDRANVILGGVHWLRWLLDEQRTFESLERVTDRLRHFVQRITSPAMYAPMTWIA